MDQLVALQEIYESFSKGREGLQSIDPRAIEGGCRDLLASLLKASKKGSIDEGVCQKLLECLQDTYELKRLGDICSRASLFHLAADCYDKALSLNRDQMVGPVLLNNLGQVYARRGDLDKATSYYQKAAQDFELMGNLRSLAHVTGNLASLYRQRQSWNEALEHNRKSLEIFEQMGDDFGRAMMTGSLGRIYADMGETDMAVQHLESSIREFQRLGDKKSGARVLDRLGRVEVQRKDWDNALKHLHKSLSLLEELGETKLAGEVLSDQGWAFLVMGDPARARESLERAMKLIGREMQPAYQNALARLAAAYSALGRGYSSAAEDLPSDLTRANREAEEKLKLASQYFARASDRYLELASFSETDLPELKISASVNRFLSYLSREQASASDEEAVALAERAISALESAVANAGKDERAQIQALQRVVAGMKEVRALSLMGNEPWRLMKAVSNSIEYLLGAACLNAESNRPLCDALRDLSASIEEERRRRSPAAKLQEAAMHLQQAEKRLEEQGEKRKAMKMGEASRLIEGVADAEGSPQSSISRTAVLNYKAHRNALLLIGWALMSSVLSHIDRPAQIFAWDGSIARVNKNAEEPSPDEERINRTSRLQPASEPAAPLEPPVKKIFEHAAKAAEVATVAQESAGTRAKAGPAREAKAAAPEPNLAASSPAQLLLPPKDLGNNVEATESSREPAEARSAPIPAKEEQASEGYKIKVIESFWEAQEARSAPSPEKEAQRTAAPKVIESPREARFLEGRALEAQEAEGPGLKVVEPLGPASEAGSAPSPAEEEQCKDLPHVEGHEEKLDAGLGSGEAELSFDQMADESPKGIFSGGIKGTLSLRLLKALLAIVLVLLGIDVILHLI
jgi:tetratricopeptide (TPR) repeat protein